MILVTGVCLLGPRATSGQTVEQVWDGTVSRSRFGHCVTAAGDVDGDGTADILVGAPFTNECGAGRGSVHVISGETLRPLLAVPGEHAGARFGTAVSALGDVNRDGYGDIVIGAPGGAEHGPDCGTVVVVSGEWITARAGGWTPSSPRTLLRRCGESAGDRMGVSVAGVADVNGDGCPDFLVGAPGTDGTACSPTIPDAGAAHLISGADGSILRSWSGFTPHEQLGRSLAAGDVNGDGGLEGVIGAPVGFGDHYPGAALVVSLESGAVLRHLWGPHAHSGFGWAVAAIGDVDGDRCADLAIGAPFWSGNGYEVAGRVDVISGRDGSLFRTYRGAEPYAEFGAAAAGIGDIDSDGIPDLVVGTPQAASCPPASPEGAVDVFSGASGARLFRHWGISPGGELGRAIAGWSARNDSRGGLLVGAPRFDEEALVEPGRVLWLMRPVVPAGTRSGRRPAAERDARVSALRAFPNPFRDSTTLRVVAGGSTGPVRLWSVDGRVVRTLKTEGGSARWDGRDSRGTRVGPGVYFVTAEGANASGTLRLVRIR